MSPRIDVEFWSNVKNLRVERGWLTDGSGQMKAACHHKKGEAYGYCGGCAARIDRCLEVVEVLLRAGRCDDALRVIDAVNSARVAESSIAKAEVRP